MLPAGSGHANTLVDCDNPNFSGSAQEGLDIHLPEDALFSVNDFSYTLIKLQLQKVLTSMRKGRKFIYPKKMICFQ